MLLNYLLIAILVSIDQIVKYWTVASFAVNEGQDFIPGILSFFYIQNDGAAWGIFSGQMWLFYIITVAVVAVLISMLHKEAKGAPLLATGLSFMIAGALGNFIDRLHLNYVIDMFRLEFMDFPIFNIADVCLTIGVIVMIVYMIITPENQMEKKNR